MESINPYDGSLIKKYDEMGEEQLSEIAAESGRVFSEWRLTSPAERSSLMNKAADLLTERKRELAEEITNEMGKPVKQSIAEVEKCAWVCRYYADNAEEFLRPEKVETDASNSFITYQPLGVIFAVMPWNFPYWQVFRFAAPNLMAGNAGLLKHASNVTGCALSIEKIFKDAGFPEGLFRTLVISSKKVDYVIKLPQVQAVTLTGSTAAGKSVAASAGSVLKKTVLELGGSDPYIILEDAALEEAAETCVTSRLINSGQSCIAAKRFIAVDKVYDEFERLFTEKMRSRKMGNPMDEDTDIGPQARQDLRDDLHSQVMKSKEKGARIILGGEVPGGGGAFYPATVITDIKPGMPAYEEELFGPAASLFRASDEDEALRIANDSVFGLGAAVFTKDASRGERIAAEKLEAGSCFINSFVKSDPRLPFGGIKESGYGRELSAAGIREFVNIKTVYRK